MDDTREQMQFARWLRDQMRQQAHGPRAGVATAGSYHSNRMVDGRTSGSYLDYHDSDPDSQYQVLIWGLDTW